MPTFIPDPSIGPRRSVTFGRVRALIVRGSCGTIWRGHLTRGNVGGLEGFCVGRNGGYVRSVARCPSAMPAV